MSFEGSGELVPVGGGDPIPLIRPVLTIGRRESCDIPLRYHNVSGQHAELRFQDGYWTIRDLNSTNGIKVNGERVGSKPLRPGDEISIAKRKFTIEYTLAADRRLDELLEDEDMDVPLLEKAGLVRSRRHEDRPQRPPAPKPPPPSAE
jgi:pSer/pThr/pTyr-binding forkhead associated (FHA) protein